MPDLQCDFCSGSGVVARYHAEYFEAPPFSAGGATLIQVSPDDWAACRYCELLIDAGDWPALVKRAVECFFDIYPDMKEIVGPAELRAQLAGTYAILRTKGFKKGKL